MARKCGTCGFPAPDGESKFCNRCGQAIVEEPEPGFPVCGTCGARVADPGAQFCDKCGGPVKKAMACPSCGNPAINEDSKFCTRCGMTFAKPGTCHACGFVNPDSEAVFCNRCGASLKGAGTATAPSIAPSIIVTKKQRVPLPVREEPPVADWDPWSDESDARPVAPPVNPYGYQDEPAPRPPQIRMPPKKYAHLPLIADELKDGKKSYADPDEYAEPPKKERPSKKGVLGFMKR
ncbi:MAG: zinc ribbon domain-containing protein [Methanoregula sp.]|nr:zinc ribbon domain-containing protein [Methanoregula sp.]